MRRIALGAALLLFAVGCGSSGSGVCDTPATETDWQDQLHACATPVLDVNC